MEFQEYLISKKIDPEIFKTADIHRYKEWQTMFFTMHPDSFTAQKKFLINDIRRRYHVKLE
tara:strand:- start:390 stop:572 length:183 start_codon:yes stop_codon:yes gene_type:complete